MDKDKILKWIANIEFEDGDKLSVGSLRTLGDIKYEVSRTPTPQQLKAEIADYADWLQSSGFEKVNTKAVVKKLRRISKEC